jgi:hypothetical protein
VFLRYFEIFTEGYGRIYGTGRMGNNDQVLTANKESTSQGSTTEIQKLFHFIFHLFQFAV